MNSPADITPAARRARLWLAMVVLAVVIVAAVGLLVALDNQDRTVRPADSGSPFAGSLMPAGVRVPDFALRDQDGAVTDVGDLRGQVVIVTFVYSTCTESCGPQAQLIRSALDDLGRDVPALAISA